MYVCQKDFTRNLHMYLLKLSFQIMTVELFSFVHVFYHFLSFRYPNKINTETVGSKNAVSIEWEFIVIFELRLSLPQSLQSSNFYF